ncbi:carboxyltransferase domain-containing protein [Streptomyces sp. M19]
MLVEFDPYHTTGEVITSHIRSWDATTDGGGTTGGGVIDVPVLFGGEAGPDLEWVADLVGRPVPKVIDLVCAEEHLIRCLGGPAASAMMDGPDFGVPVPRLATPAAGAARRGLRRGPPGGHRPVAAPSGWRQIGRTRWTSCAPTPAPSSRTGRGPGAVPADRRGRLRGAARRPDGVPR